MRVAIYVRVSTQEQAKEGYSIKAQIERLKAYAVSQSWKVVETYIDDGESAKDMNRTDLKRMLKDMEQDIFDVVLVYKLDRLTRSVLDLYKLLETFENHNVKFKSATEVYDTTNAMGRLFITLTGALAQFERENIAERVKMGMEQKAKEGKWVLNMAPFGYDLLGKDELGINEAESKVVKEIFELYTTGRYGMSKVAKILNQKGIKTKSGADWNMQTIRYVLTNPIYIGTMRYNYRVNKERYFETKGAAPAVISESLFEEVQKLVSKRSALHPRKATSPHLFAGVARCARCGSRLSGKQWNYRDKPGQYYFGYYCPSHTKGTCDLTNISQNYLEIQFMKELAVWQHEHKIDDGLSQNKLSIVETKTKINDLEKSLIEIKSRRTKWQYAWMNGFLTDAELKSHLESDQKEMELKEKQLHDLTHRNDSEDSISVIKDILKDLQSNWNELDAFEKRRLIEYVISDIYVDKTDIARKPESVKITDIKFL